MFPLQTSQATPCINSALYRRTRSRTDIATPPIHRSGRSSPTQIREYVNTRRTIHPPIHSRRPSVPCGTCLEFTATQCSVYVVAGILPSTSKVSPVRCVISSLTLNAIVELSFCTVPLQQFLWQRNLNRIHRFIHSFVNSSYSEKQLIDWLSKA